MSERKQWPQRVSVKGDVNDAETLLIHDNLIPTNPWEKTHAVSAFRFCERKCRGDSRRVSLFVLGGALFGKKPRRKQPHLGERESPVAKLIKAEWITPHDALVAYNVLREFQRVQQDMEFNPLSRRSFFAEAEDTFKCLKLLERVFERADEKRKKRNTKAATKFLQGMAGVQGLTVLTSHPAP